MIRDTRVFAHTLSGLVSMALDHYDIGPGYLVSRDGLFCCNMEADLLNIHIPPHTFSQWLMGARKKNIIKITHQNIKQILGDSPQALHETKSEATSESLHNFYVNDCYVT